MSTHSTNPEETNKETVRSLYAAFAACDDRAIDALLTPDFVAHDMPPGYSNNADGLKRSMRAMHEGLHDCTNEIVAIVADEDKVVTRYVTRATHGGELFGVPPSRRAVTLTGMEMFRLALGKVAELWGAYDMSELFAPAEADTEKAPV